MKEKEINDLENLVKHQRKHIEVLKEALRKVANRRLAKNVIFLVNPSQRYFKDCVILVKGIKEPMFEACQFENCHLIALDKLFVEGGQFELPK